MEKFGSKEPNLGWSGQHRIVRCHPPDSPVCTGQSGALYGELASLGLSCGTPAKNHRTVRAEHWTVRCNTATNASIGHISAPTVGWEHRTVRCPPEKEGGQSTDKVTIAPVSGMHRTVLCTHGQSKSWSFRMELPTAPRPLGAIKGTPRRHGTILKHLKSILQLRHSVTTPSSDLREIRAPVLSIYCVILFLRSCLCFLFVCCCVVLLCVCSYSLPYSGFGCDHCLRL
jgi:hypothetical protein